MRSKNAIHSLKHLANINNIVFVAVLEPFVDMSKIEGYRKFLGFQYCKANVNGKIWCFWKHIDQAVILADNEQHLTINFKDNSDDKGVFITSVYAKCTKVERTSLWDSLEVMNNYIDGPWCVWGRL